MTANGPTIETTILDQSQDSDGCHYVAGTTRVNFESQQRKALNLVEALFRENKVQVGGRVAVIGAGLSGLTVAASLLRHDCEVDLFEMSDKLFTRYRKAKHRHIHPNLSFWPMEELSFTTDFPHLNWHADSCDRVVAQVEKEWIEIADRYRTKLRVRTNAKVLGVTWRETSRPAIAEITVSISDAKSTRPPLTLPKKYSTVIKCTGFGNERHVHNTDAVSYWQFRNSSNKALLILGSGDGGLIDALLHIFDLDMETLLTCAMNLSDQCNPAGEIGDPKVFATENEGAIDKALRNLLPQHELCRSAVIVTRSGNIFSQDTAVLHRILAAYAEIKGLLTVYTNSELKRTPIGFKNVKYDASPQAQWPEREFLDHDFELLERVGPEQQKRAVDLVRHRGVSPLPKNRSTLFAKSISATYRWIDQMRRVPPAQLHFANETDCIIITCSPKLDGFPESLFGIPLKMNVETVDWDLTHEIK